VYETIPLGPLKLRRDDSDVDFNLLTSYRRAHPDDRVEGQGLSDFYDGIPLPKYTRHKRGAYRPGVKRDPRFARYGHSLPLIIATLPPWRPAHLERARS